MGLRGRLIVLIVLALLPAFGLLVWIREDGSRTRERTLGNNLSWLRRFAVTLLKRHPAKDSLRGKMLRCAYSPDFLTEVLTQSSV